MFNFLKNIFLTKCHHEKIKITDRKSLEKKCDCCQKILYNYDVVDFKIVNTKPVVELEKSDEKFDLIEDSRLVTE